ncbi:MAG: electron transfer flavoprotein subunit alpha/FixB family protein [Gammaproteobacteria bacterium]|nr:MAG: electron transfer flavoprotein subunit alpha/FixB family protein [Gammaproteobacteria bacterium]
MSVVVVSFGAGIERGTEEALTAARMLAAAGGQPLVWAVAGIDGAAASGVAARHGVARLDVIAHPRLADCGTDVLVEALAQYCAQRQPGVILFNQTAASRLVAPRLAGRIGAAVVTNAFALAFADGGLEVTATAFGGDTHVIYRLVTATRIACLTTTALIAEPVAAAGPVACETVAVDLDAVAERFRVTSAPRAEGPRLEDAEIIVSGGRGFGSASNYDLVRQLAGALGGLWGGSRAIVDDGWIDSSRQVGLTGKITRPRLYIAAGISGASQHMAGCAAARTIVAINKDRDAAIFRYARYGIVGDCLEVMPELIKAAQG